MQRALVPAALPRGVYQDPAPLEGRFFYYSVNARGHKVRLTTVPVGADATGAIAELWTDLDKMDPQRSPTPSYGVLVVPSLTARLKLLKPSEDQDAR